MEWNYFKIEKFDIQFKYPNSLKTSVENDTYVFYNENLGSFRITPIRVTNQDFNINGFLSNIYEENSQCNPQWINFGSHKFVYYKENSTRESSIIHYFFSGQDDLLILSSFAYDASQENSTEIKEEIRIVEKILSSIKFS